MDINRFNALNDEIWNLKEKCFDLSDARIGNILYRLCSLSQEIINELPISENVKEENDGQVRSDSQLV